MTAVLGPVVAIVLGVAPARAAPAPFADPIIFLFIGGFILAEAMFVHGVDRRIAFTALSSRLVGSNAPRILIVYGGVATGLSMWISNTATTAMMFPIGLAIGELAFATGLAGAIGNGITAWLPGHSALALTMLFTAFAILLSEATSNTASANMILPVVIAVSQAAGVRPLEPALGATLGASMGFMMPISTAPNAIVYSSGHVPITAMMRYGLALDVAAFVVIVTVVMLLGPVLI